MQFFKVMRDGQVIAVVYAGDFHEANVRAGEVYGPGARAVDDPMSAAEYAAYILHSEEMRAEEAALRIMRIEADNPNATERDFREWIHTDPTNPAVRKFEFDDDSRLVVDGAGGWDVGVEGSGPDCFCGATETPYHEEGCPEYEDEEGCPEYRYEYKYEYEYEEDEDEDEGDKWASEVE